MAPENAAHRCTPEHPCSDPLEPHCPPVERRYFAREPSGLSVIDEWAVLASGDPERPVTVEVDGTGIDLTVREAKSMRAGLSRAIKETTCSTT